MNESYENCLLVTIFTSASMDGSVGGRFSLDVRVREFTSHPARSPRRSQGVDVVIEMKTATNARTRLGARNLIARVAAVSACSSKVSSHRRSDRAAFKRKLNYTMIRLRAFAVPSRIAESSSEEPFRNMIRFKRFNSLSAMACSTNRNHRG